MANEPRKALSKWLTVGLSVAVATLVRVPFEGFLQHRVPYATYFPAVSFCALAFGLGPSLACVGLSAVVASYFYVAPYYSLNITEPRDLLGIVFFVLAGAVIAWTGELQMRATRSLEEARRSLRAANEELERRVEERTAALAEANDELSGFTYTVAHDLRSSIRSIVANARLLTEDEGDRLSPEGRKLAERVIRASLHLAEFVDDLLTYARTGRQNLRMDKVDLAAIFRREAEEAATHHGCQFSLQAPDHAYAVADPSLATLLLHNLVDNACKYRKPGEPAILEFLELDVEGERAFVVRDEGIGFESRYAQKVFAPFERLHPVGAYPGTGIGLANVRRAVERLGGRAWAESEPGRGSSFYFTLGTQLTPQPDKGGQEGAAAHLSPDASVV